MESALQNLLGSFALLLHEEYRQLRRVGPNVAHLGEELATMNALLRMQSETEPGAMDHFVRECMKQVRDLAFDAEDRVDEYMFKIKSRPNDGDFVRMMHHFRTLRLRRVLAEEINDLRNRAIILSERHARYKLNHTVLRPFPSSTTYEASAHGNALRPANDPENIPIGLGDQADLLIKFLTAEVDGGRRLKVCSILGFGGFGKTTLAKEVCRLLELEFRHQAMVSVCPAFAPAKDLNCLLKHLLQELMTAKTADEKGIVERGTLEDGLDDNNRLAEKLKWFLKNNRCLIVIDDLRSIGEWLAIQPILPQKCDSRIIVTTRMQRVAEVCCSATFSGHLIYSMVPLEPEDSKKLFNSRAFGSMDVTFPLELVQVMDNIITNCCGIPLATTTIAGALAGYRSPGKKDVWETICKSIDYKLNQNPTLEGMMQLLTLSYDYLPYELKGCMMYLSIFPAYYEINKDRLLCRWIAEGLVPEKRGLTQKEVAESYFNELISRSMIEPVSFRYDGRVQSCRVHDMILEVILSKSLEAYFVALIGGQHKGISYDRIRRLSIQGGDMRLPANQVIDMQHIRSLSMFQLQGHKLLDDLDKFTLLRVLDLEDCEGVRNKHVILACRLYLLKFLSLKGTNINKIPPQVGKLEHLQVLDTRDTCLVGLPETVTKLEKLEHLLFSNRHDPNTMWRLPQGLRKMKALQEVSLAILGNDIEVAKGVAELQQLQHLRIKIDNNTAEEILQDLARSLCRTYSLEHFDIHGRTLNFLHSLTEPPQLLRCLRIDGAIGESLPTWVGSLTYLIEFSLACADLVGDQLFDVLCKLPQLKSICVGQRCYKDRDLVARTRHNFPSLICLKVICNTERPKAFKFEEGSMPKLETLLINFSDKTKKISGIENLTNLREVELTGKKQQSALDFAINQLTEESTRRSNTNQKEFKVVVKYE